MSVGKFCNREVVITGRETSILETARLMRRHHVGDVIVAESRDGQQVPVGIVTDRDMVVELLAEEVDLKAVDIGDVMSFDLVVVQEDADLLETVKLMRGKGVRRIPVVNDRGGLVGLLALDDLLELIAEQVGDLVHLIRNEQEREHRKRP